VFECPSVEGRDLEPLKHLAASPWFLLASLCVELAFRGEQTYLWAVEPKYLAGMPRRGCPGTYEEHKTWR